MKSAMDGSGSEDKNSSTQGVEEREYYIYDLPMSKRKDLCTHLDSLHIWQKLAQQMHFPSDRIDIMDRESRLKGCSPSDQLLRIWGHQYNHTTTELFVLLYRLRLFKAMTIIRDFVSRKHQICIPIAETKKLSDDGGQNTNTDNNQPKMGTGSSHEEKKSNNAENGSNTPNMDTDVVGPLRTVDGAATQKGPNVEKYISGVPEIDYQELAQATNNWNSKQILGKGGFGVVFWGYWKHTEVAIKQIHYRKANSSLDAERIQLQQSLNELHHLNCCRHDNILPLYGFSISGEHPCLVYQLMKGGSLEKRLYPKSSKMLLNYEQRLSIALGTARGINFLHTLRKKPLIHGDIKPANILLDQNLLPKIGDFGLAREGPNNVNTQIQVSQVFGTKPYLPPEFLESRALSSQVDTYSFGIVLLEMFTGLRVFDKDRAEPLLNNHIMRLYTTNNPNHHVRDLLDKRLAVANRQEEKMCQQIIMLAIKCIAQKAKRRPDMGEVLQEINDFSNAFNRGKSRNN